MNYREQLRQIAAYQHGIITTADADEHDIPTVELRKLARRSAIRRIGHGVYRFDEFPRTTGTAEAEAVAMVGEYAYLEGASVLALLNLGHANPARIEVAVLQQNRRSLPPWIKASHRTTLKDNETTYYHGVPSVHLEKALQQTKSKMPRNRWEESIYQAERHDLIGPDQVRDLLGMDQEAAS